ncbi:30S ribosome-binding factor RbfA [Tuwongella immobilis]|uniref:Ribosome-binding factor A n=1 Tax=Tuwongella immobilis TaxID=692036 RepID=A0A6C2YI66_9BACT|nr:30S ribosome-binding factor RbfA [Tuwongella immobilis]VIP01228.1 ribosome-binding factor a : Ribosome-binding factor A OS=Planctomyces limnophilus (strain ATCC 43296 / DSM 3776 / IFAM 1008 / 290) GN=rbfA PE=3 SV=1: RBFA [Tuwongella immobilis]VTR97882.1 ribosome-binding factor a : Ribosome-binding factor A OS=Planctomyces limnophilus (strain ATCC 43296 / DSM 3776 / IFAM 1008 / 290) GN=rbfA PE=3 SV=1: RBFA [Tuwongella immobilis]
MKSHRLARINSVIREVASETILFEIKDPRVKMVTVTRAEVSADLQHAKIYVSVLGTEAQTKTALHGLRSAAGFVQSRLGDRMKSRYTPVLHFVIDEGVKNSIEITRLINEALKNGKPDEDSNSEEHFRDELDSASELGENEDFTEEDDDSEDLSESTDADESSIPANSATSKSADSAASAAPPPSPQTGAADGSAG